MYYKEQNKNLLSEIERIRQIMGLSLITEQYAWIDNLINAGSKRITSLDNIISKLGLKGKILKDADIDKIVDELPEIIDDNAKNQIRSILKKDKNLKASLANQDDDFLLKLRNSKDTTNIGGFSSVVKLTSEEVSSTVRRVINKFLDDPLSNVSKSFDMFDESMTNIIEKNLLDGTSKLRNVDEIYDIADTKIRNKLIKEVENGMSNEVANEIFTRFKTKIRTDSKLKTKLDEITNSNRVLNLPKRTTSVDNFNSKVELSDELSSNKNWFETDNTGTPTNTINGTKKFEIEKFFSTNSYRKKKFQEWVRKVLYQGKTKEWKIIDLDLTDEVKEFIEKYDSDFYKNLKDEKYRSLIDDGDEWDKLNMLDTNNKDGKEYLNDLLLRKKGTTNLTEDELDRFLEELNEMSDNELLLELDYLKQNKNRFTEKSSISTRVGDVTENYFIKDLLDVTNKLSDEFELVYHAGSVKGNPIDTILGIDVIIKNKKTGELFPVQVKKTNSIYIKPSKVNPDQDSFSFWLTTPIRLKNGYGVVIDNKNNFVMFGPQMQYKKVNDQWIKTNPGFNRRNNINYVDINLDGESDFITNIDF